MTDTPKPLGYWLIHIHNGLEANFAALLESKGVVRRQWQIMNTLARGPLHLPDLDHALAPFLDADTPTVAGLLDPLAARGWLVLDPTGAYALTDLGRTEYTGLAERIDTERAATIEGLTRADYDTLIDQLRRIATNVDAIAAARQ
ncbi:MarR family winged helix-turn-helix transcriptional regulator [Nocardia yamanashiensis]|uniref:MarR family winged helix-turn-helix transcriptional regulator n=1 Tax=Nocardia yamanashiensis TaxID=209247 RepID=UPI000833C619|nr:MarR family winged helix-turn-helix transcriptional regulator [Nocardia yamanashiensis]